MDAIGRVDKPVTGRFRAGRGRDSTLISGMEIGVDGDVMTNGITG